MFWHGADRGIALEDTTANTKTRAKDGETSRVAQRPGESEDDNHRSFDSERVVRFMGNR